MKLTTAEFADNADSVEALTAEQKPEQKPQGDATTLYRVQLGAFEKQDNATAFAAKLKKEGFDTYIVQIGKYYNCLLYTSRCV